MGLPVLCTKFDLAPGLCVHAEKLLLLSFLLTAELGQGTCSVVVLELGAENHLKHWAKRPGPPTSSLFALIIKCLPLSSLPDPRYWPLWHIQIHGRKNWGK